MPAKMNSLVLSAHHTLGGYIKFKVWERLIAEGSLFFFFFPLFWLEVNYFIILYWFCHTSTWIHHRCTRVPHPEPPSLPVPSLWVIPVHQPQASSIMHQTWTGDSFHMWCYTCFNAVLPNHPILSLSQSPKDCSIHLCLFCCLTFRVIITIFLNSIYMR